MIVWLFIFNGFLAWGMTSCSRTSPFPRESGQGQRSQIILHLAGWGPRLAVMVVVAAHHHHHHHHHPDQRHGQRCQGQGQGEGHSFSGMKVVPPVVMLEMVPALCLTFLMKPHVKSCLLVDFLLCKFHMAGLFFSAWNFWNDLRSEIMDDYGIYPSVQRQFLEPTDMTLKVHQLLLAIELIESITPRFNLTWCVPTATPWHDLTWHSEVNTDCVSMWSKGHMACYSVKSHVRKRLLYRNSIHAGGFGQTAWFQGVRLSSNKTYFFFVFSVGPAVLSFWPSTAWQYSLIFNLAIEDWRTMLSNNRHDMTWWLNSFMSRSRRVLRFFLSELASCKKKASADNVLAVTFVMC